MKLPLFASGFRGLGCTISEMRPKHHSYGDIGII